MEPIFKSDIQQARNFLSTTPPENIADEWLPNSLNPAYIREAINTLKEIGVKDPNTIWTRHTCQ